MVRVLWIRIPVTLFKLYILMQFIVCKFSSRTDLKSFTLKSKYGLKESKLWIQQDAACSGGWGRGEDPVTPVYVTLQAVGCSTQSVLWDSCFCVPEPSMTARTAVSTDMSNKCWSPQDTAVRMSEYGGEDHAFLRVRGYVMPRHWTAPFLVKIWERLKILNLLFVWDFSLIRFPLSFLVEIRNGF